MKIMKNIPFNTSEDKLIVKFNNNFANEWHESKYAIYDFITELNYIYWEQINKVEKLCKRFKNIINSTSEFEPNIEINIDHEGKMIIVARIYQKITSYLCTIYF